jgi:uncharacterized protein YcfL
MKTSFRTALALALVTSVSLVGVATAQRVKGMAEIGLMPPVTKVVGNEVVTTLTIKNLSKGPIAGLKVSEFWYDKQGNSLPGATLQLRLPISVGAVKTLTLKTPRTNSMQSNKYKFSHAYGEVTVVSLTKIE